MSNPTRYKMEARPSSRKKGDTHPFAVFNSATNSLAGSRLIKGREPFPIKPDPSSVLKPWESPFVHFRTLEAATEAAELWQQYLDDCENPKAAKVRKEAVKAEERKRQNSLF